MSRRVSLPARTLASEDTGLDPVDGPARTKSGSVSSDDGDLAFPKQGKFFKNLTRSLDPEVKPPPKKDYLDEYQRYKAKRALSLHGVVKQQTIDLGMLGGPSSSSAAQNRRFSTGMHPPQAPVNAGKEERSATLPMQPHTAKKGPPPPVAPRKKSVNLPPIQEPTKILTKLPSSPGHETPSYILSAAKKEQHKAEIDAHKPPPVAKKPQIVKNEAKQNNLPCDKLSNETPVVHMEDNNTKEEGILTREKNKAQEGESTGALEKEGAAAERVGATAVNDETKVSEGGTAETLVDEAKVEENGEPKAVVSEEKGLKQAVDNESGEGNAAQGMEPTVKSKDTQEAVVSNEESNDVVQGENMNTPETAAQVLENNAQKSEVGTENIDSGENVGVASAPETPPVEEVGSVESEGSKDVKHVEAENVTADEISEKADIPEGDKQGVENHTGDQGVVSEQTESNSIPEEKPSVEEATAGKENIVDNSSTEKGVTLNNVSTDVPSEGGSTTAATEGVASVNGEAVVNENGVDDVGSATPGNAIPSTESTPTGNGSQSAGATEKLSKTADLLLSFSQDKKENLNVNDGDLKGIGAELLKLNSTIEEISGASKKEVKVSQDEIEKLEEIDAMRREMEAMRQEMDLFG